MKNDTMSTYQTHIANLGLFSMLRPDPYDAKSEVSWIFKRRLTTSRGYPQTFSIYRGCLQTFPILQRFVKHSQFYWGCHPRFSIFQRLPPNILDFTGATFKTPSILSFSVVSCWSNKHSQFSQISCWSEIEKTVASRGRGRARLARD